MTPIEAPCSYTVFQRGTRIFKSFAAGSERQFVPRGDIIFDRPDETWPFQSLLREQLVYEIFRQLDLPGVPVLDQGFSRSRNILTDDSPEIEVAAARLPGSPLSDYRYPLETHYVRDIVLGTALILSNVIKETKGIVYAHNDIKPANMLWDRNRNEVSLIDWGTAGIAGLKNDDPAVTAEYMPLGFLEIDPVPRHGDLDVVSLAKTAFYLLVGSDNYPSVPDHEPFVRHNPELYDSNGWETSDLRIITHHRLLMKMMRWTNEGKHLKFSDPCLYGISRFAPPQKNDRDFLGLLYRILSEDIRVSAGIAGACRLTLPEFITRLKAF